MAPNSTFCKYFLNILVYLLLPTWSIYRNLTISKKTFAIKKKTWRCFFYHWIATKFSILFCNSVKFCTHKKAIWEEHLMWLFSIHKLVSNINEQGWNDTELGYEAAKLICLLIFMIFKLHKSMFTMWVEIRPIAYVLPLLMSFFVIHVIVLTTYTSIVKLLTWKCSFDIILIDHSPIYL